MTILGGRRTLAGLVAVLILTSTVGGCGRSGPARAFEARPAPPVVGVTMQEYRFEHPPQIPSGRVIFEIRNSGREQHKLALLPLDEQLPPLDAQLRGSERRIITPFAGIPPRQPGRTGTFAVDLVPGQRYALVCFLSTPAGELHALKGMNAEFRATAG